ncbi:hypothetical protein LBMAG53_27640 [Planctomycetota bacterium]|nr:hypothetical protein LBMAG53_27640 [Planctomycetota bacterium]
MRPLPVLLALVGAIGLAACFPPRGNVEPPAADAAITAAALKRFPGTTAEQVALGRTVMVGNCKACHGLPAIASEPAEEWEQEILPEMAAKAKLSETDKAALVRFVLGARDTVK